VTKQGYLALSFIAPVGVKILRSELVEDIKEIEISDCVVES